MSYKVTFPKCSKKIIKEKAKTNKIEHLTSNNHTNDSSSNKNIHNYYISKVINFNNSNKFSKIAIHGW